VIRAGALLCAATVLAAAPAPVKSFRLPSGLVVRLAEDHERPLVRLEFRIGWTRTLIPPGREAWTGFLARMLASSGAGGLDRESYLRSLEEQSLRASFQASPDAYSWSLVATSASQDEAFRHLALAVARPLLQEEGLQTQRQLLLHSLARRTARERAEAQFLEKLGGAPSLGDEAVLEELGLPELERFRRWLLRPERAVLVIHGDLSLEQARKLVSIHFGAWGPGPETPPESRAQGTSVGTRCWLVPASPGRVIQAGCSAGCASQVERWAHRLLQRELASGGILGSGSLGLKGGPEGPWLLQASYPPEMDGAVCVQRFQGALVRLRERKWMASDLAWVQAAAKAEAETAVLHPAQLAASLAAGTEANEVPGLQELQACLQRKLDGAQLHWLILGGKPGEVASLEAMGLGPITLVD